MSMTSQQHAYLADHGYGRDPHDRTVDLASLVGKETEIGGLQYKVLAHVDKSSGYQGTVYQRVDTGEIIVSHRGTEFDRERMKDLVKTDGGMVVSRTNDQAQDAIELTREALRIAEEQKKDNQAVPSVTVTGHSLGGTLAQITGHYFGLKGDTYNAFGAARLNLRNPVNGEVYRLPEGGTGMTNHVMAADLVSSGAPHYGQVRVYTNEREINTLQANGYENTRARIDWRNDVGAAISAMRGGSHDMDNFLPWNSENKPDQSILAHPQARALADQYDPMIDRFRGDVGNLRAVATALSRSGLGHLQDAVQSFREPLPAGEPARRESTHLRRGAALDSRRHMDASDMRDSAHPAHGKYQQAYTGVSTLDRDMGRMPDARSERLAASLTAASAHIPEIATVTLSKDGSRAFALGNDSGPGVRGMAHVETATAMQTTAEESTRQWHANTEQHALNSQVEQQKAMERAQVSQRGPVFA